MRGEAGAGEGPGNQGWAGHLPLGPWELPEEGQVACSHEVLQRASCCHKEDPVGAYSLEAGEPWSPGLSVGVGHLGHGQAWSLVQSEGPWHLGCGGPWRLVCHEGPWSLGGEEPWGSGQSVGPWEPEPCVGPWSLEGEEPWSQEHYEEPWGLVQDGEPCGPEGGEPQTPGCEVPWPLIQGQAGLPLCSVVGVEPWPLEHCEGPWGVGWVAGEPWGWAEGGEALGFEVGEETWVLGQRQGAPGQQGQGYGACGGWQACGGLGLNEGA